MRSLSFYSDHVGTLFWEPLYCPSSRTSVSLYTEMDGSMDDDEMNNVWRAKLDNRETQHPIMHSMSWP